MRINTATPDPASRLAAKINAAMARDAADRVARAENSATGGDLPPPATFDPPGYSAAGQPFSGPERESVLHEAVVRLLRASALPGAFWTHFPAGEKRSEATGRKLARMSSKPGVPDFLLVVAGRALFLELKTANGKLSAFQKQTHAALVRAGAEVAVVRSLEEAAGQLRKWDAIA